MEDIELHQKNIKDLRIIAKKIGVKSPTTYNKTGLIEAIKEIPDYKSKIAAALENMPPEEEAEKTEAAADETAKPRRRGRPPKEKKPERAPLILARQIVNSDDDTKEPEITFKKFEPAVVFRRNGAAQSADTIKEDESKKTEETEKVVNRSRGKRRIKGRRKIYTNR